MKIGITERGDASIDYTWEEKLDTVDGAILITKNVTDSFISRVLPVKDKVILHLSVTGFGGTVLEPHVMSAENSMKQIKALTKKGFPLSHVVIRVDPIIPTAKGIKTAKAVIMMGINIGITRFRISILDMYPHVRDRFRSIGIECPYGNCFSASKAQIKEVDNMLKSILNEYPNIFFECCAEPELEVPEHIGCIDIKDIILLGLNVPKEIKAYKKQRPECLCLSCKTELLTNKFRCPNECLYCYWKDKERW